MTKTLSRTPWGKPQNIEIVSDQGIVWYSTASHGGYKVDSKLNKEVPEQFRDKQGWYEEDCAWSIVWVFLSSHFNPGVFKAETMFQAHDTLLRWYPHQWQEYNGVEVSKSDKCWDCAKNTCYATANQYPKELANTGYGNYRILTRQLEPKRFETAVFCQNKEMSWHYSEYEHHARENHSKYADLVISGHYERCGYIPAYPIIK